MTIDMDEIDGMTKESCRELGIPIEERPPKKSSRTLFREKMEAKWQHAKEEGPYCGDCLISGEYVRCTVAKATFWGKKVPLGLFCPVCRKLHAFTEVAD